MSDGYSVIVQWREIDTHPVRFCFSRSASPTVFSSASGAGSCIAWKPPMLTIWRPSLSTPHTVSDCHSMGLTTVSHSMVLDDDAFDSVQPEMNKEGRAISKKSFVILSSNPLTLYQTPNKVMGWIKKRSLKGGRMVRSLFSFCFFNQL